MGDPRRVLTLGTFVLSGLGCAFACLYGAAFWRKWRRGDRSAGDDVGAAAVMLVACALVAGTWRFLPSRSMLLKCVVSWPLAAGALALVLVLYAVRSHASRD
jgi:uncharacterized membrane protein